MQTIYKYPLEVTDEQEIEMPRGANVLTVQVQYGKPCLWALVDNVNMTEKMKFVIHGTGHPVVYDYSKDDYIGTFQLENGHLVYHVFQHQRN